MLSTLTRCSVNQAMTFPGGGLFHTLMSRYGFIQTWSALSVHISPPVLHSEARRMVASEFCTFNAVRAL